MKLEKLITRLLFVGALNTSLFFMPSVVEAQTQTKAQTQEAITDNTWIMLTDNLASQTQGTNRNYMVFPLDKIKDRADKGMFIEELIFTPTGWNILFTNKYKKQVVNVGWSQDFYEKSLAKGLSLTELTFGRDIASNKDVWIMVMSDMGNVANNDYIYASTWEDIFVQAQNKQTQVFKVAYGAGKWFALCSKDMGLSQQINKVNASFPTDWVNANIKAGLVIVDVAFAAGKWHVLMGKSSQITKQNYYLTDKWEYKYIWDEKNERMSRVYFAYDIEKAKSIADQYAKAGSDAFPNKDYKTAVLNYTNAINAYGYYSHTYSSRGGAKYNMQQYEGAIQDCNYVINHFESNNTYCLRLRAMSYIKLEKYKEAIEDYTKVLAADKDKTKHAEYYAARSSAYEKLGEYKKALADIDAALAIKAGDKSYTEAKNKLSNLVAQNKPIITWDTPFNLNTTVDKSQFKIAACINAPKNDLTAVKIYINGKEVNRDTRGFSVEDECTQSIAQNIVLTAGKNELEIVAVSPNGETRSEKRYVTFNAKKSQNNYHALLIGVADYADPSINKLNKPVKDAESLKQILTSKYTFEESDVHILKNPTKAQIAAKFRELASNLTDKDNLLIFYAGHGTVDSVEDKLHRSMEYNGYWLPADAKISDKETWLANSSIYDYLHEIPAKHTLVVADACFSGSLLRAGKRSLVTTKATASSANLSNAKAASEAEFFALNCSRLLEYPSCKAMTSGNLTEVPDKSLFMASFLNALESNTDSCMPGDDLFYLINKIMRRNQVGQEAKYEPFQSDKHQNGEFVFKKR